MDAVAMTFVDLILVDKPPPCLFNVVHPHGVPCSEVFDNINQRLSTPLPVVPFDEWVQKLERYSEKAGPGEGEMMVGDSCRRFRIEAHHSPAAGHKTRFVL